MAAKNVFTCAALAAFLLVLPLSAQKVLLLPNSGSTVSAFSGDPFTASTPISANTGVFAVLSNPTGTRYFFVSSANVTITDSTGAPVQTPIALGQLIKAAATTPDGRRLLVVAGSASAGSLYIFDISLGVATQTGAVTIGNNPSGVAAALDSTAAFVLTASGLSSVDLSSNTVTKTVALLGVAAPTSGVVSGPNGLFYVNAQNALYEINPRTMTVVNTIAMNAFPTKPVFTPDGAHILLANPGASSTDQLAALVVSVADHSIESSLTWWGLPILKLLGAPGNRLFVVTGTHVLAQLASDLTGIQVADFGAGPISSVTDAVTSTDVPTSGWPGSKYLYVLAPTTLYRIDLSPPAGATVAQIQKSLPVAFPSSTGVYLLPVSSNTPELAKFGDGQNLGLGGVSLPLVVRAADSLGRPVFGAAVSFAAAAGTFVGTPMTATNADGLAQAVVQAPAAGGAFYVSVTVAGGGGTWFSLNSTSGGGGGPGPGPSGTGLQKLLGDGQVGQQVLGRLLEPLAVILRDANGNPVPSAQVTFAISGTGGAMSAPDCTNVSGSYVCLTDTNGVASIRFTPPDISVLEASWVETSVTASTTAGGGTLQFVTFTETGVPAIGYVLQGQTLLTPTLGGTITVQAGQTVAGAIRLSVFAQSGPFIGGPMPNVGIHMSATNGYDPTAASPPVYCSGGTPLSGADGIVTCDLVAPLDAAPGTYPLWVMVGGNTGLQMNVVVTAAPPVVRVPTTATPVSGDGQSGAPGAALQPLVAVVKDQLGSVMPGIAVQWAVISGSAQLAAPTSTLTDANGRASTGIVLGNTAGPVVVRMTASSATPANFNLTVTPAVGGITKISGDGQSVLIGQAFQPLTVKVTDILGQALPGIAVSFSVTSGIATPTSAVSTTDAQGLASATFSATSNPSQIVIAASASGQSVAFTLSARLPGPVLTAASFLNGASFQPGVPIGGVVAIRGTGLTTGLTVPAGSCISATPDGNLERGLPTRLAGTEIWFSTRIAPIFSICVNADGTEQVNVQAPYELAPATITVVVKIGVGTGTEVDTYVPGITVVGALPGIFEYNVDATTRIALAQRPDGTIVSPTNKAKVGETLRLYTTGIGWVLGVVSNQPGYPGQVPWGFTAGVEVNGVAVPGATAEYAQNLIGIFLVSFTVPNQVGSSVPITVSVTSTGMPTVTSLVSRIPIAQ